MKERREKLLLHTCCAPCATYTINKLSLSYKVIAFFYNPNIWPEKEYTLRLEAMKQLCSITNTHLVTGSYNYFLWLEKISGYEREPEGGERCGICFAVRLEETAKAALRMGISIFATTLTISPHKDARLVNTVGRRAGEQAGINFLEADYKKQDGFKKSCEQSRSYGLYRQKYCGCAFSKKEK